MKARLAVVIALKPDSPDEDFKKALSNDDWYVRGEAALAVARLKKKLPVDDLTPLLNDQSWFVRSATLDALGECGESAGAAIQKMLDPSDPYLCAKAAELLGELKFEPAAESLVRLLSEDSPAIKAAAARALGRLKSQRAAASLEALLKDSDPQVRLAAVESLGEIGDSQARAAIEAGLKDAGDDAWTYSIALYRLGNHDHLDAILDALISQYEDERFAALRALKEFRDPASVPALVELAKAADPPAGSAASAVPGSNVRFRVELARALGEFNDTKARAALISMLQDARPEVRASAVDAIADEVTAGKQVGARSSAPPAGLAGKADDNAAGQAKATGERTPTADGGTGRITRAAKPLVEMTIVGGPAKGTGEVAAKPTKGSEGISADEASSKKVQSGRTGNEGQGADNIAGNSPDRAADRASVVAIIALLKNEQSPIVLEAIDRSMKRFDRQLTVDALLDSLKSGANVRQVLTDMGVTTDAEAAKLAGDGTLEEKLRAVDVLARLGDHKAVEPLAKTLASTKDPALKAKLVETLGLFKDRNTENALLDASRDPDPQVRSAAISALGRLGDGNVTGTLFDATRDSSEDVRDAAFRSLGLMGISVERLSADVTNPNWQTRITAVGTLARLRDPRAVPVLITALSDSDQRVRAESARALAVLADSRAVEPLIAALKDSSPDVRFQAAAALGTFKDHRSVAPLEGALTDRDSRVSEAAAESLARLNDPEAIRMLIGALGSEDWRLRARAAQVLMRVPGAAASPDAIPRLVQGLRDRDLIVRYYSAEALVSAGAPAVPQLVDLFRSGKFIERERAGRVLGRIGRPSMEPMNDIIRDRSSSEELRAAAAAVLGIVGDAGAIDPLISLLRDQRYYVREQAAVALGRIGGPAIDQLVKMSESKEPATRESAVAGLGGACSEIRHEIEERGSAKPADRSNIARCVETIERALGDSNPSVKLAAVQAMGATGSKDAIDPLMAILRDEQSAMRGEAAVALGKIGQPAVAPLISALSDSKPLTRKLAAQALGDIRSNESVPALMRLVSSDVSGARAEAIEALGKIGDPRAVDTIVGAMQGSSSSVKLQAIQALALLQGTQVEGVLIKALGDTDEDVRQAAATGLAAVGTGKAIPALEKLADDDPSADVRSAAVSSIQKLKARK